MENPKKGMNWELKCNECGFEAEDPRDFILVVDGPAFCRECAAKELEKETK